MSVRPLLSLSLTLSLLGGCAGPSTDGKDESTLPEPAGKVEYLSPTDHLVRVSMALRGLRPSQAEIDAVRADPAAIDGIVDAYVQSPEFGETIKDLHAELLLLRTDTQFQLPVEGPLEEMGANQADIYYSTTESPLRFVEKVVMEDMPYTTVVTADWMLSNDVLAAMYGLPYEDDGEEWQVSRWSDGRPLAGLLSDSEMWRRHVSNGYNFHRGRANVVADKFLCEDFASRDVLVEGGVALSDPFAVADAVNTQASCVGCHQAMDPLAAFFWGYKEQIMRNAVSSAYQADCSYPWGSPVDPYRGSYRPEHFCYPIKFYEATEQDGWEEYGLPAPAFYGEPGVDAVDLGEMVAEDTRFSMCTVRNFYSYFAEIERDDLPMDLATDLRDALVASDWSAKELAKQIVLSEPFRAARKTSPDAPGFVPGSLVVRPEQYARMIEDLTGFRWLTVPDSGGCAVGTNTCWGETDLMTTDRYGYRAMFGGVDGLQVTSPIHGATPTKMMVMDTFGSEAAGFVVDNDFAAAAASRRLLTLVEADVRDEAAIRAQLVPLHERILGEAVTADSPEVDETWNLFAAGLAAGDTPADAWKLVLSAMFQDPRVLFY